MLSASVKKVVQAAYLELPALLVSLATVELFFKLHSFLLETLVFLGIWFVLRSLYLWGYSAITGLKRHPVYNLAGLAYLQLLPFLGAMLLAANFYKFHSFILETGAFLVTWFALALIYKLLVSYLSKHTRLIPAPEAFYSRPASKI